MTFNVFSSINLHYIIVYLACRVYDIRRKEKMESLLHVYRLSLKMHNWPNSSQSKNK